MSERGISIILNSRAETCPAVSGQGQARGRTAVYFFFFFYISTMAISLLPVVLLLYFFINLPINNNDNYYPTTFIMYDNIYIDTP
jgi:hypothetical protein